MCFSLLPATQLLITDVAECAAARTQISEGGYDEIVLDLESSGGIVIPGTREMVVVPRATHLFEEPVTHEQVAALARDWFIEHLSRVAATANP
jgi:putative phosphoribosyl transferase